MVCIPGLLPERCSGGRFEQAGGAWRPEGGPLGGRGCSASRASLGTNLSQSQKHAVWRRRSRERSVP
jgi:hypothetical protein